MRNSDKFVDSARPKQHSKSNRSYEPHFIDLCFLWDPKTSLGIPWDPKNRQGSLRGQRNGLPTPKKCAPGGYILPQRGPPGVLKESPRGPQGSPRGFQMSQGVPKGSPRDPQGVPKGFPRDPQGVPKGSQRDPQGVPRGSKVLQGVGGMLA